MSRAPIPYHLFRMFSRVAGLHPFVQNDGPVSIARAFVPDDWRRLCAAAGLNGHDVEIRSYKPARAVRKPEEDAVSVTEPMVENLVIGGGLSGAMAGLRLAQAGREVVLLERERKSHHKVCGEFLSPGGR